jgi:hypothetical protein
MRKLFRTTVMTGRPSIGLSETPAAAVLRSSQLPLRHERTSM